MRWVFVALLVVHGLIHLMGFAKAFDLATLRQLRIPISHPVGLLWLGAAFLMLVAAASFLVAPRWFWLVGSAALVVSQSVIFISWADAKFGTIPNMILLVAIALRFASYGPTSLRAEYTEATHACLAASTAPRIVTEDDLRALPAPVQTYVRLSGAIGQPQIESFRATWKGRIRGSASDPWMSLEAEQYNFYQSPPARLFFIDATMKGLPVDVFHRFIGDAATFRVRLLGAFTMVDAKGPEMNRGETVTLFNDMCILAASRLIDPSIQWQALDALHARARYTRGAETITADLVFNDAGELVDFVSDDRFAASADGKTFTRERWTTPVREYREVGGRRVSTVGEARWDPPGGSFTYIELELVGVEYNRRGP